MKVIEDNGGVFELGDEKWESVNVKAKLSELFANFQAGDGDYPQMRSVADRPLVPFSDQNEIEHTPFYTTTSGSWNVIAVSDVLCRWMLDTVEKGPDEQGIIYYEWKSSATAGGHIEDPRYDCWWRKVNGMPVQLEASVRSRFLDRAAHKSAAGNSKIGRMVRGKTATGDPEPSALTGKVYAGDLYVGECVLPLPLFGVECGNPAPTQAETICGRFAANDQPYRVEFSPNKLWVMEL